MHAHFIIRSTISIAFCIMVTIVNPVPAADQRIANWLNTPNPETDRLQKNWQALRQRGLRLLPVPKYLEFIGQPVRLTGPGGRTLAVVLDRGSKQGAIAANEIISRVRDLAPGVTVALVKTPQADAFNLIIENHWPNTFTRDSSRPKQATETDQAYGLYPATNSIILSGQGRTGMLYAAVTLRWLISRRNGEVVLHPARVTDWPDFKFREIGTLFSTYYTRLFRQKKYAKAIKFMQQAIDHLFRMKATASQRNLISTYRKWSPFSKGLPFTDEEYRTVKTIADYARTRNIVFMDNGTVALGWERTDKDRPEIKRMMHYRVHHEYHSWAMHDLHRKKANLMSEYIRRSGIGWFFVHAVDGGGIRDPENWSERDPLTREKYGDNRVQADLDMFNIYVKAIKQAGGVPILVVYPYSGTYLDEKQVLANLSMVDTPGNRIEVRRMINKLKAWTLGINQHLDKDVRVCLRENNRATMDGFAQAFPGRPLWIYYEVAHPNRDTQPLLSPEIRCFWSAYRGQRNFPGADHDIIWLNTGRKFKEPAWAAASEYAWNAHFPGWSDLARKAWKGYYQRGEAWPSAAGQKGYDIESERAAVGTWGNELGQVLKDVFRLGLSLNVAVDPRKAAVRFNLRDYLPLISRNRDAVGKANAAFDRAWKMVLASRRTGHPIPDKFTLPLLVQLYTMTRAARPYIDVHYHLEKGRQLARQGKLEQAGAELKAARNELAQGKAGYEQLMQSLRDEPILLRWSELGRWSRGFLDARLMQPDFAGMEKQIADLDANKEKIFQAYNVPSWLEAWLARKRLAAAFTAQPLTIDGKLDEPVWRIAPPIEHFVAHKSLRMAPQPIQVRMAYDETAIYLAARVGQPLIAKITEPKRSTTEYAFTESVEWMLAPAGGKDGIHYQFVIDSAGNLFTLKYAASKSGPIKRIVGWQSNATVAVQHTADGWSCEIRVPLENLGKKAGKGWLSMIACNHMHSLQPRKVEPFACKYFAGKSFHAPALYPSLDFIKTPKILPAPAPVIECLNPTMVGKTHAAGAGSLVSFGLRMETRRPMHAVTVKVQYLDRDKKLLRERILLNTPYLPLTWMTTSRVQEQLERMHKAIRLRISLSFKTPDNEEREVVKTIPLGDLTSLLDEKDIYPPGVMPGTNSLGIPVYFDINTEHGALLSFAQGSFSFWVRPHWNGREPNPADKSLRNRCFIHYGRIRPKHPTLTNLHNIVLLKTFAGFLVFRIANAKYQSRQVIADIRGWKQGEWHHLACTWNMSDPAGARMTIYVDGKRASGKPTQWGRQIQGALATSRSIFAMQVGSFNSGLGAANADIDELIVSTNELPAKDFTPSRQPLAQVPQATLYFPFEHDLAGRYRIADITGTITAHSGVMGKM